MNEMRRQTSPARDARAEPTDPMARINEMLLEQAISLDGIFADLTDYAAETFAEWPDSAQAYIRLALRAQSSCRSSLEAIARVDRARAISRRMESSTGSDIAENKKESGAGRRSGRRTRDVPAE